MSNQPNDLESPEEALDDLDVPAEEADAVSGGITFSASEDDDQNPEGQLAST